MSKKSKYVVGNVGEIPIIASNTIGCVDPARGRIVDVCPKEIGPWV